MVALGLCMWPNGPIGLLAHYMGLVAIMWPIGQIQAIYGQVGHLALALGHRAHAYVLYGLWPSLRPTYLR